MTGTDCIFISESLSFTMPVLNAIICSGNNAFREHRLLTVKIKWHRSYTFILPTNNLAQSGWKVWKFNGQPLYVHNIYFTENSWLVYNLLGVKHTDKHNSSTNKLFQEIKLKITMAIKTLLGLPYQNPSSLHEDGTFLC